MYLFIQIFWAAVFGRFFSQTGPDSGPVLQSCRFILVMLPHDKTSHL